MTTSYKTQNGSITLRKARQDDEDVLSDLAYRAYKDRFFNDAVTDQYGGSLKIFPALIPDDQNGSGQNRAYFERYWAEAMPRLNTTDNGPEFNCYVADFTPDDGGPTQIIGFIKGDITPLDDDLYQIYCRENEKRKKQSLQDDFNLQSAKQPPIDLPATPDLIAELGSLYIAPDYQYTKVGRALTQIYTQDMQSRGYETMVTRCYSENNSQNFFAKMGAVPFSNCPIPQNFEKSDGTQGALTLPGETLFWSAPQMDALARADVLALASGEKVTSNTTQSTNTKQPEKQKPSRRKGLSQK